MKPTTKLFIKNILVTGLTFGLTMSIIDLIRGEGFVFWKFLFLTIFFGLSMSLFSVYEHIGNLKNRGVKDLSDENLNAIQKDEVVTEMRKETFIEKLMELKIFKKAKLIHRDGGLTIRTRGGFYSIGEIVKIDIQHLDKETFKYSLLSKPKHPLALVNGGNGYAQIQEMRRILKL